MSKQNIEISHHAILYALLAKETIEKKGQSGKRCILRATRQYGEERGQYMAQNAMKAGHGLGVEEYLLHGMWRPEPGEMEQTLSCEENTVSMFITKCPWCDSWKAYGLSEYGQYYCTEIDEGVVRGFNPQLGFCVKSILSHGDSQCEFQFEKGASSDMAIGMRKEKMHTCERNIFGFAWHAAHLLHVLGNELVRTFGEEGAYMVCKVKSEFVRIFDQDTLQAIMESEFWDNFQIPKLWGPCSQ